MTLTNRVSRPKKHRAIRATTKMNNTLIQMETETAYHKGEGFRSYYIQKIEELQLIVAEKSQNLRRLQAQRNELNAKGKTYSKLLKE